MRKGMLSIFAIALMLFLPVAASAATIQIQFSGLNLAYDGSNIYDATSSSGGGGDAALADQLVTMSFFKDGAYLGTLTNNIYADVNIGGVYNIPLAGGTVYSTGGGIFDLLMNPGTPGWGLALNLASGFQVDYNGTSINILGSGLASSIFAQALPFGLAIGDPVQVSFSAGNMTKTAANGYLTGFTASGTGEVSGSVPEPGTLLLLGTGLIGIASFARRRIRK